MSSLKIEDSLNLIREVGEEIVTEEELIKLLESGEGLIAYDGFEPSGQIHIAQGILRAININKMIKAGVRFKMYVADWHAMANNKMGGDLEKIKTVGKYFIEVWRASGMDLKNVEFIWASDMAKNSDYWKLVVQVGRTNVLKRFIRTAEMMGREESLDKLTGANIIYSCMQVADIFLLGAKITQLGMDQRKLNMLAREIGPQLGFWKPVVVSHHMLMGLRPTENRGLDTNVSRSSGNPPASDAGIPSRSKQVSSSSLNISTQDNIKIKEVITLKMSKSNPDSAIFMTDTFEDIKRKITKAYCPEGVVEGNPILEYYRYIIFESFDRLGIDELTIDRPQKFGGPVVLNSPACRRGRFQDLEKIYANKELHPQDLKNTLVELLDKLLQPVRKHFQEDEKAKNLLKQVVSYQITR